MKREIKFRVWSKFTEQMIPFEGICSIDENCELWSDLFRGIDNQFELMQFTGLKDMNGKEIYEGDIIRLDDIICPITWFDGGFQMITSDNQGKSSAIQDRVKKFEVIGNIYENPELNDKI